jgi:hypothetical protein
MNCHGQLKKDVALIILTENARAFAFGKTNPGTTS